MYKEGSVHHVHIVMICCTNSNLAGAGTCYRAETSKYWAISSVKTKLKSKLVLLTNSQKIIGSSPDNDRSFCGAGCGAGFSGFSSMEVAGFP